MEVLNRRILRSNSNLTGDSDKPVSDNPNGSQCKQTQLVNMPPTRKEDTKEDTAEKLLTTLLASVESLHKTTSGLQNSITMVINRADENTESIKELTVEIPKKNDDINRKLDTYLTQNDELRKGLLREKERGDALACKVEELTKKEELRETEKRALNLFIRGIPEAGNEKMHEVMRDFLCALGASFGFSATFGAHRIGRVQTQVTERPGPVRKIRLKLATTQQKSEMFGLLKNLKQHKKCEKVAIMNELNSDELLILREPQQVHLAA